MAIPNKNLLGNPNITEGDFQIAIESLRESVAGSGKAYDSANTYSQYDTCVYNGVTYYSKTSGNIGNPPVTNAYWGDVAELIAGVVHKTGNELITGEKTFINNVTTNSAIIGRTSNGQVLSSGNGTDTEFSIFIQAFNVLMSNPGLYSKISTAIGSSTVTEVSTAGLLVKAGGLGYGNGAGGTVTQATSKVTPVKLNKICGQITTHNSGLASGAIVEFTVNNSLVSATDIVLVQCNTDSLSYRVSARASAGAFVMQIENKSTYLLSQSLVINFSIIKGAIL